MKNIVIPIVALVSGIFLLIYTTASNIYSLPPTVSKQPNTTYSDLKPLGTSAKINDSVNSYVKSYLVVFVK